MTRTYTTGAYSAFPHNLERRRSLAESALGQVNLEPYADDDEDDEVV